MLINKEPLDGIESRYRKAQKEFGKELTIQTEHLFKMMSHYVFIKEEVKNQQMIKQSCLFASFVKTFFPNFSHYRSFLENRPRSIELCHFWPCCSKLQKTEYLHEQIDKMKSLTLNCSLLDQNIIGFYTSFLCLESGFIAIETILRAFYNEILLLHDDCDDFRSYYTYSFRNKRRTWKHKNTWDSVLRNEWQNALHKIDFHSVMFDIASAPKLQPFLDVICDLLSSHDITSLLERNILNFKTRLMNIETENINQNQEETLQGILNDTWYQEYFDKNIFAKISSDSINLLYTFIKNTLNLCYFKRDLVEYQNDIEKIDIKRMVVPLTSYHNNTMIKLPNLRKEFMVSNKDVWNSSFKLVPGEDSELSFSYSFFSEAVSEQELILRLNRELEGFQNQYDKIISSVFSDLEHLNSFVSELKEYKIHGWQELFYLILDLLFNHDCIQQDWFRFFSTLFTYSDDWSFLPNYLKNLTPKTRINPSIGSKFLDLQHYLPIDETFTYTNSILNLHKIVQTILIFQEGIQNMICQFIDTGYLNVEVKLEAPLNFWGNRCNSFLYQQTMKASGRKENKKNLGDTNEKPMIQKLINQDLWNNFCQLENIRWNMKLILESFTAKDVLKQVNFYSHNQIRHKKKFQDIFFFLIKLFYKKELNHPDRLGFWIRNSKPYSVWETFLKFEVEFLQLQEFRYRLYSCNFSILTKRHVEKEVQTLLQGWDSKDKLGANPVLPGLFSYLRILQIGFQIQQKINNCKSK
jgi:hypothetical protein